jgi:hypothetical protein
MLNYIFQYLNIFDGWIAQVVAGLVRTSFYGAVSGFAAVGIYAVVSNQRRLRELKNETRRLRGLMRDTTLSFREVIDLNKKNLIASLRLLAHSLWPCVLSSVPPIVMMMWFSNYQSYTLPLDGKPVNVTFVPERIPVVIEPAGVRRDLGDGRHAIVVGDGQRVRFGFGDRTIYEGIIAEHSVDTIHKERWWNAFLASEAGYIRADAPIEEIKFDFPRKRFIENGADWIATWEFQFFLALVVSSLTAKVAFHVE